MAIKLDHLEKEERDAIISAYLDYQMQDGEKSLFSSSFSSEDHIRKYLEITLETSSKLGWIYAVGDNREAYISIDTIHENPKISILLKHLLRLIKAVGIKDLMSLAKHMKGDGIPLAEKLKREKKPYIHVEMLVVRKEYRKKGFMRKTLDVALQMADEKGIPCILETDERNKAKRYEHLGMNLYQVRKKGSKTSFYDMIYYPK